MAFTHSAKSLQLLRNGATIHGLLFFKHDNESIRPSHLDRVVAAIYEDMGSIVPGGESLSETLTIGDTTNDGQVIKALNGGGQLNLRAGGDNIWEITSDNGGYSKAWVYGDDNYIEVGYNNFTWFEANPNDAFIKNSHSQAFTEIKHNLVSATENVTSIGTILDSSNASIKVFKQSFLEPDLAAPAENISVAINSRGTFANGVNGTVAIGLSTGDVISDNSLYVEQVVFKDKGLSTGQLRLGTEGLGNGIPANDWFQAFQAKNGTIALLSDIPAGGNGIFDAANNGGTVAGSYSVLLTDSLTLDGNVAVTGQVYSELSNTVTPTVGPQAIDWNDGNSVVMELGSATGDILPIFLNPKAGATYFIKIIQGSLLVDVEFPSNVLFPGETAPYTLNVTEVDDAIDSVTLFYDGTKYLATYAQNYG